MANVISSLTSSDGCRDIGPGSVGTNLFDGVISDFFCPGDGSLLPPELIVGADSSIVTGIRVYASTANPEGDPKTFSLDGRAENGDWISIVSNGIFDAEWNAGGILGPPPDRNTAGVTIDSSFDDGDEGLSFGFATFVNTKAYSEYRVIFPRTLSYPSGSQTYLLRVGEVELVGLLTDTPSPTMSPVSGISNRLHTCGHFDLIYHRAFYRSLLSSQM